MDNEKVVGLCPKCGEKLEIPSDLETFCCIYCGQRMERGELLPEKAAQAMAEPVEDAEVCLDRGIKGLVDAVVQYPDVMKNVTREAFVPFFAQYEAENREAVRLLDLAAQGEYAKTAERAAERFLPALGARLEENHKALTSRAKDVEDAKFTLCLFLIPVIRKQGLPISELLAQAVHAQWQKVYPKHPFSLTTYETIVEGFQKRKLCFITTAVCESMGKPDNCAELTAFRSFRDGYLSFCPDGEALIQEYYNVAPGIVTAIRMAGEDGEFHRIWTEYLAPCYAAIGQGENAACKKTYTQMVQALKRKYLKM